MQHGWWWWWYWPLLLVEMPRVLVAKTAAAAHVRKWLDYFNSLLYGSMDRNLNRLQRAQNILAHVVLQATRSASATGLWQQLHWLPVWQRIIFKMATVTYKVYFHTYMTCYGNTSPPGHYIPPQLIFYMNYICAHSSLISHLLCWCTYHLEPTDCKHLNC